MIDLRNITHFYNRTRILDDISLSVKEGEILALLGENGAGKTTLMRICAAFLRPSLGTVNILGKNITDDLEWTRANIGYMPEGAPLYGDMTVISFLRFIAEAKKIKTVNIKTEIDRVTDIAGVEKVLSKDIFTLSKGYKRRVSLAAAIISDPKILLLDEPAEGLDPNQKNDFKERLKEMGKAVIISTHVLEDVKAFAGKVAILHKNKIVYEAAMKDIENKDLNEIFRKHTLQ